jgi:hypothetical protein
MLNINNNLVSSFYTRNNKHVKKHIVRTLRRSPLTIYITGSGEGGTSRVQATVDLGASILSYFFVARIGGGNMYIRTAERFSTF